MQKTFRSLRLSFFPFCLLFYIGCYPRFPFCLFVCFQGPRSLRIGCASVFVWVVSPVELVSGKTPKNLRLHRWLALFCPRLLPLPLLLLPSPRLPPDPLSLIPSFFFRPGFRPSFPFSFFLDCECHFTHWSPKAGQRVVPPFLQWFHTASAMSEACKEIIFLWSFLSKIGYGILMSVPLYIDNQRSISWGQEGIRNAKHIMIRRDFVREQVLKNRSVDLRYLSTQEMPADMLTKALKKIRLSNKKSSCTY